MSGKVVPSKGVGDTPFGGGPYVPEADVKAPKPVEAADEAAPADLRLIIEETGEPGQYVYTVVDRRTGRIVSQLSREEVLRMRERASYAAGAVFDGMA